MSGPSAEEVSSRPADGSASQSSLQHWRQRLHRVIRQRLSLQEDKASDEAIDQTLRQGVEMRGTNLWVLVFAIFVASIGLNVNSTAVIIGAMLISPLMGPIMGLGYGVGIHDFALIRESFKNLGVAVLLALLTSTLYFLISPLDVVQSELLARTTPTIWDVLIALVGGLAGIVGVAHLVLRQAFTPAERARLQAWLQARLAVNSLRLETSLQR